jgi:putative spermidine/putrescine transport system permease protein
LVVVSVAATLQTFDIRLELAAMSLGADRVQTFGRITLPLIARGVLAGAIFAFAVSFDELILALFLLGPSDRTLPMRIWEGIRTSIDPIIAAVAALMITLAVLIALVPLLGSSRSGRTATE